MRDVYDLADRKLLSPRYIAGCEYEELEKEIDRALKRLSYRSREVLRLRFGLSDGYEYTFAECAMIFRVSRAAIYYVAARALYKLNYRNISNLKEWKDFFEEFSHGKTW